MNAMPLKPQLHPVTRSISIGQRVTTGFSELPVMYPLAVITHERTNIVVSAGWCSGSLIEVKPVGVLAARIDFPRSKRTALRLHPSAHTQQALCRRMPRGDRSAR